MTTALYEPGPQSGGRRPAPGRLVLVQAFVNSFYDLGESRGADTFATADGFADWLAARGLGAGAVSEAERRRAVTVREGLRALLFEHNDRLRDPDAVLALRDAADGLPAATAVDADGATEPVAVGVGVEAALGLVLAVVHEARASGTWPRLKACPGQHCGWAFYDRSLSRTSRWCSMQVCGGREKARAYRQRARTDQQ